MIGYIAHHKNGTIVGKVAKDCIDSMRQAFETKGYRFEVV